MGSTKVQVVSYEDYLPARKQLLEKEKAWMKAKDDLNKERRTLPIMEVTKDYIFTGVDESGKKVQHKFGDLFFDRRQLIVYHAMFDPSWDSACSSCSLLLESLNELRHLNSRSVTLVVVSRAPIEKIQKYKERLGWTFPWVSSNDNDFNYDFQVTVDKEKSQPMYNFRDAQEHLELNMPWFTEGEQPGHSCFVKGDSAAGIGEDGKIYHTYSSYARGGEGVIPTFAWLDMTLLGRQDGISGLEGLGFRRHDSYTEDEQKGIWRKDVRITADGHE